MGINYQKRERFDTFATSRKHGLWQLLGAGSCRPQAPCTLNETHNYTAFAIASAAVDSWPKCPARTVVLENHIGRILENQDPVELDILRGSGHRLPG